ncbi:MAG: PKD domain-containing protein [Bacteroidales bacterium]|nr:PKD domain-containing protein [Bacteroidales bacterium]
MLKSIKYIIGILVYLFFSQSIIIYGQSTNQSEMYEEPYWTEENYIPPVPISTEVRGHFNLTSFKQFGEVWSPDQLGTCTSSTIGSSGCAMTCVTMIMDGTGIEIDPGILNEWLTNNSGYSGGCNIIWNSVSNYPGSTINYNQHSVYTLDIVRAEIDGGNPVIAWVNGNSHFVLIKGYDNDGANEEDFYVYDPGTTPTPTNWADYSGNCEQLRLYNVGINIPAADFSVDNTNIVAGQSINFTDESVNNPTVWYWTFEGGVPSTSQDQNPVVIYNTPGEYSVSLMALNINGRDVELKQSYITVTEPPAPISAFSADNTTIATGQSITFADESTNNPTSWQWTFEGCTPATSTEQNPTVTYNTPGVFDVSLTSENDYESNTETKTDYVTVGSPSGANFTYTVESVTKTVNFTDASSNNPTNWQWNFGDGSTSTSPNPSHDYSSYGTYEVTLEVANDFGSSSVEQTVQVSPNDVEISGRIYKFGTYNQITLSGASIYFNGDTSEDGNYSTTSGYQGYYSMDLPYEWSGTIVVVYPGYAMLVSQGIPIDNITEEATVDIQMKEIQMEIVPDQIYGSYYNFTVVNAPIGATDYNWSFFNSNGFDLEYSIYSYSTDEFLPCHEIATYTYVVSVNVNVLGEDYFASVEVPVYPCPTLTPGIFYDNDCSVYPLGSWVSFQDISSPFTGVHRLKVWYEDGTLEYWDKKNCSGLSNPPCHHYENKIYTGNCHKFKHLFSSPGQYSASIRAVNNAGYESDEYWFGFSIVDCNETSTYLPSSFYSNYGNVYKYYSGRYTLSSFPSTFNNQNTQVNACDEIILEGDVTIEPTGVNETVLQINPCLKNNNTDDCFSAEYMSMQQQEDSDYLDELLYRRQYENEQENNAQLYINSINIYPNPNNGAFTVSSNSHLIVSMKLINAQGMLLETYNNINKPQHFFSIDKYAPGIYYLEVETENTVEILKISYTLTK